MSGLGKLLAVVICTAAAVTSYGQSTTSTIFGRVDDPTRAVIPKAEVSLRNLATNEQRKLLTDEKGGYIFAEVIPGTYTIEVTKSGFSKTVVTDIQLVVQEQKQVNVALRLGAATTVVTDVSASSADLETQSAALGQVITEQKIVDLPLNGRDFLSLTYLTSGVVPINNQNSSGSGALGVGGGRTDITVSISGNREMSTDYIYDGVEAKSNWVGVAALYPPPDAIQEFKVQKDFFSPEFGAPAVINVITKSGGSTFHGSAWEFLRNNHLDALNYFAQGEPPQFKQNQFGGTAGGRIPGTVNHHWFAYYEGLRIRLASPVFYTLPSPRQLQGNFSDLVPSIAGGGCPFDPGNFTGNCLPTPSSTITDPITGTPFAGNIIPNSRINSFAAGMAQFFPAPNQPMNALGNFYIDPSTVTNNNQFGIRTDHNLSSADSLHFTFSFSNSALDMPGFAPKTGALWPLNGRVVSASWTRILRPTLINEFRFGWTNDTLGELPEPGFNPATLKLINNTPYPECEAYPNIFIGNTSGFSESGTGGLCLEGHDNDFLFYDNVSWTRGKHFFTFGTDIQRASHLVRDDLFTDGSFSYLNAYSGNDISDVVLGVPSAFRHSTGSSTGTHQATFTNWFFNDDFRATQSLTINLGLRYENHGVLAPTQHNASYFDPSTGLLLHPPADGLPSGITARRNTDFAPRVGLAYRLGSKTSLRAGYGIFFTTDPNDELSFNTSDPPTSFDENIFASAPGAIAVTVGTGAATDLFPPFNPSSVAANGTASGNIALFSPSLVHKDPNLQQWTASIQRELPWGMLLEIAYAGNAGTHLSRRYDQNEATPLTGPPCATTPVAGCDPLTYQERKPFPRWDAILTNANTGTSDYNGLQARLEKRTSHGLWFLADYTWSHAISEDDYDNLGSRDYDPLVFYLDRSNAIYDRRQRGVVSLSYNLPFGEKGSGFLHQALGGWTLTSINQFMTGPPYGISTDVDYAQVGGLFSTKRPQEICNANLPSNQRRLDRWFNTSCFVPPILPFPHLGNTPWNLLTGPGLVSTNVGLLKVFGTERFHAEFRTEFFNAFNHPNFNVPNGDLNAPTFGVISSAQDPREIQFALKLKF